MEILLMSRYDQLGASSRIRAFQYIPYLKSHEINVTVAPLFSDSYLRQFYANRRKPSLESIRSYCRRALQLLTISSFDLLWIEKELFPYFPAWVEEMLKWAGIPYVVDYDDATFHSYDLAENVFIRKMLGNKIDKVMNHAALVIAGNDYLAARARKAGAKRVECIPSVVDLNRYTVEAPPEDGTFVVGWIGSPSTTRYLKMIEEPLSRVCSAGNARLVLVGSSEIEMNGVPIEIKKWSEDSEVADIQSFHVGIMPLIDNPWEKGKCGYKLIQYMACGLPVVASPVGVNRQIVDHGVNGFLAICPGEWVEALTFLMDDHEARRAMGKAAREKVAKEYSLQVNAPLLLDMLRAVAEEGR